MDDRQDRYKEAQVWAHEHFGAVELGDARLTRRAVHTAAALRTRPGESLPRALGGWAALKAAYRLFEHEGVTYERLVEPHTTRTQQACRRPGDYLLVDDTTKASFSHRGVSVPGLGPLTTPGSQGLVIHTSLALRLQPGARPDTPGLEVLGLFGQQAYARPSAAPEADRWARALFEAGPPPPGVRWIWVADREADAFEPLWGCWARGIDWVVRAAQSRRLHHPAGYSLDAVAQAPLLGTVTRALRARPGQPARPATLEVRALEVAVKPPQGRRRHYPALPTGLVEVRETGAPAGVEPLHWVLLTSLACQTLEQARAVVALYGARWTVEDYHKALKTGTGLQDSQLQTGERLRALVGLLAVVAVDLLVLKSQAQANPDGPVDPARLGPEARAVLEAKFGRPEGGWTHATAMRAVARLGGFLGRRGDGRPGWQTLWRGYTHLMQLVEGYHLAQRDHPPKRCG